MVKVLFGEVEKQSAVIEAQLHLLVLKGDENPDVSPADGIAHYALRSVDTPGRP